MHDSKKIVKIDAQHPESDLITRAGKIIRKSGVVIFPAKCLYGVAADASDDTAIEKVFQLKQRPLNNPILVLISKRSQLLDLVKTIPDSAQKLMDAFWPGNITIVLNAKDHVSSLLTAHTGKIGIRMPSHPVAKALTDSVGTPITGTSANISGQESCYDIKKLDPSIVGCSDHILDAGTLKGGAGSTIVDVTAAEIKVLRQGEISKKQIAATLEK